MEFRKLKRRRLCEQNGIEIIEEYIKKQLQEDIATDQISIKEYVDPFEKGRKRKKGWDYLSGSLRKKCGW